MNMRVQMTDEQLMAQRAARTGRSLPTNKAGDESRGPGEAMGERNPLDGFNPTTGQGFDPNSLPPADSTDGTNLHSQGTPPAPANALEQQLAAANGRLGPMQRQLEEMRATMTAMQATIAQRDEALAAKATLDRAAAAAAEAANFDPFEGMSNDDLAMMDEATVNAMRRTARAALAKATAGIKDPEELIAKALDIRDRNSRDRYVRSTAEVLNLVALGNDAKFQQFLRDDDSAGLLLNSFVQSPDLDTARSLETRVRSMLKRYEKSQAANSDTPPADPQSRLSAHLSRNGNGNGAQGSQRKALTPEEAKQVRIKATQLTRNRKFKEANELLAQLN